jgi:metal-responsive CopG/Arc/MetJ family transcriptional regulator
MEESLLKDIDSRMKKHNYSTRTEFIREAIRSKLSALEKEEAIKKLAAFKGSLHSNKTDEEIGEAAMKKIAKKFNFVLD